MDPDQTAPLGVCLFSVTVESMHTLSTGNSLKGMATLMITMFI